VSQEWRNWYQNEVDEETERGRQNCEFSELIVMPECCCAGGGE